MPDKTRFCPSCGTPNESDAAFCGECGHALNPLSGWNAPQTPGGGGAGTPDRFDLILMRAGAKKIQVITIVREVTGLGLAAVKTLVESAPFPIKTNVSAQDAEQIRAWLDALGATVEVHPTGTARRVS